MKLFSSLVISDNNKPANKLHVVSILVQNSVFCTIIALLLWKFVPSIGQHGFLSSFIYSQSIGTCVCLLGLASRRVFKYYVIESPFVRLASITLISLVGAFLGLMIATVLVGKYIDQREYFLDINSIAFSALIAVVASYSFNAYLSHRKNVLQLKLAASEESRRADNARHAMLQAQLEPHMLFNTLANLRALINTDTEKAIQMLDRLDSFLRETLSSSTVRNHSLEHEFSVLEDYLALMKVRFADRLHYVLNLNEDCKERLVPSLILQPIVENAIKHGIEPQISGGEIIVTAKCVDDKTVLSVSDTGVGYASNEVTQDAAVQGSQDTGSGGFGLSNLKDRLAQSYGDEATLNVAPYNIPDNTGTTITITLPLHSNESSP